MVTVPLENGSETLTYMYEIFIVSDMVSLINLFVGVICQIMVK